MDEQRLPFICPPKGGKKVEQARGSIPPLVLPVFKNIKPRNADARGAMSINEKGEGKI